MKRLFFAIPVVALVVVAIYAINLRQKPKVAGMPIGAGTLSTVFDNSHHVGCYIFTPREEKFPPMISCVQLTDTTTVRPGPIS